jgi:hypothetical protein
MTPPIVKGRVALMFVGCIMIVASGCRDTATTLNSPSDRPESSVALDPRLSSNQAGGGAICRWRVPSTFGVLGVVTGDVVHG